MTQATDKSITIYTDGSCLRNPGPGGWAALITKDSHQTIIKGGHPETTNNQMELMATIEALAYFSTPEIILLYTDSKYVQQGITLWIPGWIKKNWKTAAGKPVKNQILWERLYALNQKHQVQWEWVKAHADNPSNNLVDQIAREQAQTYV